MWAAIPLSALPSPPRRSGGGCGPSATEPAGLRSWLCGAEFVLHDLVVQAPALARPAIDMDREREAFAAATVMLRQPCRLSIVSCLHPEATATTAASVSCRSFEG